MSGSAGFRLKSVRGSHDVDEEKLGLREVRECGIGSGRCERGCS